MATDKSAAKGMDLGVTDADWMFLRNGLHLVVVESNSCSFISSVTSFEFCLRLCSLVLRGVVRLFRSVTFPIVGGTCIGKLPSRNTVKPVLAAL